MDIVIFVAGIIVGYFIEKILDFLLTKVNVLFMNHDWQSAEKIWEKYKTISRGLEVIQTGWINNKFEEKEVIITIDGEFSLIQMKILDEHHDEWEKSGIKNNVQIGILDLDPHRISDDVGTKEPTHELRIHGQTYKHFEFLSTHIILKSGPSEERKFLENLINKPHYLEPTPIFPNPLSVGLSLFCENGNCLVLTKRTKLTSSGGMLWGGSIYNAVGENATLSDADGKFRGITKISIWNTAKRGLEEEMGIEFLNSSKAEIVIHSLIWDKRILDYKFFGYLVNQMSRAEVYQSWMNASDRHESWELIFNDVSSRDKCREIVESIVINNADWASECSLCTIRGLLNLRKISPKDLDKILSETKL
jgi:hypothetical protein